MLRRLRGFIGRTVLAIAGAFGGGLFGLVLSANVITLMDSWSHNGTLHTALTVASVSLIGAICPRYSLGFLSFVSLLNEDDSEMPLHLLCSTLGYLVGLLAVPLVLLFRIKLLAVASLVLTVQFAIAYGLNLSALKRSRAA